jgi:hypothetical protein
MGVAGSPGDVEPTEGTDSSQESDPTSPSLPMDTTGGGTENTWEGLRTGMAVTRPSLQGAWGSDSALDAMSQRPARLSAPGSSSTTDVGAASSSRDEPERPERPPSARKRFHSPRLTNDNPSEYRPSGVCEPPKG